MKQHFLLSAKARSLSVLEVARLTDEEAEGLFAAIRWEGTDGKPVCPHCGCGICYAARRKSGRLRYRCKACRADFSLTSGTLFAAHKLPIRDYLVAIAMFCNESKGKNASALSRDLGIQHKSAWVLLHKIREAMWQDAITKPLGGKGVRLEVDGGYFGGFVRQRNHKRNRIDRRTAKYQNGKRKCVVVARDRFGTVFASAFRDEPTGALFLTEIIHPETEVMVDEARSWNCLEEFFDVKRINHSQSYSIDDLCTNLAESFFSRMRRSEIGVYHHIAGPYLDRYATEHAWRERNRRLDNGTLITMLANAALNSRPSKQFSRYWQRSRFWELAQAARYPENTNPSLGSTS